MPPTEPVISVCVPTFRRPRELERLLKSLVLTVHRPAPIEIVVCDNDLHRSAQAIVAAAAASADVPVVYQHEPVQNISRARNRLAAGARGDWIAFIDDDELPASEWLCELWRVATTPGTDGAKGPVQRKLPAAAPAWLHALTYGGAFLPPAGTPLPPRRMSGGNIMVRRTRLLGVCGDAGPFDETFGLRGGEDILTYGRMILRGAVIRAAPAAPVGEVWPPERCSTRWMLQRAYRSGQLWSDVEALLYGPQRKWLRVPVAALRAIILLPVVLITCLISPNRRMPLLLKLAGLVGQASVAVLPTVRGYQAAHAAPSSEHRASA